MFNNRDLVVLGAGGLLAVFALLLPLPSFVAKLIVGFLVLAIFMVIALMRIGPDRVTIEEWLLRRVRFATRARSYTFHRPVDSGAVIQQSVPTAAERLPVILALDEVGIYPLVSVFLAVVAVYTLVWLVKGGAEEISHTIRLLGGGL